MDLNDLWDIDFSSDGNSVAVSCIDDKTGKTTVKFYDAKDGRSRFDLVNGKMTGGDLSFSPDGTRLLVGTTLMRWSGKVDRGKKQ